MRTRQAAPPAVLLMLALCLAGCADVDPFRKPFVWQPTGANAANLAAMVENPTDLARGRDMPGGDGQLAAAAVDRLRQGHVKPLPESAGGNTGSPGAGASLSAN